MPKNTTENCPHCGRPNPDMCKRMYGNTTTENGWEEEFEKFWYKELGCCGTYSCNVDEHKRQRESLKTFIQQIAKEEYERGFEAAKKQYGLD